MENYEFHVVYKTTNSFNGKIYIGAHSTNNLSDGSLGSGKILIDAVKKYGKETFLVEIIEFFNTRKEAFEYEKILVDDIFVSNDNTYNICTGGLGCSEKSEEFKKQVSDKLKGRVFSEEHCRKISLAQIGEKNHRYGKENPNTPKLFGEDNGMYGKKHSIESIEKISNARKLSIVDLTEELCEKYSLACKNKKWYNNGIITKRFYDNCVEDGFVLGRLKNEK
jgi:group I intron endonuclease